jgi:hypothetical protein
MPSRKELIKAPPPQPRMQEVLKMSNVTLNFRILPETEGDEMRPSFLDYFWVRVLDMLEPGDRARK